MLVLKSTHKAMIAALEEAHKADCHQFESRILELHNHPESLKRLVFAPVNPPVSEIAYEADQVITPVNDAPVISQEEADKADFILRERDRIFSGEWDQNVS